MNSPTFDALNPAHVAGKYIDAVKSAASAIVASGTHGTGINVVGLITGHSKPSLDYGRATKQQFTAAGLNYELKQVPRLALESEIELLNDKQDVHGVFIYFPVFNNQQDDYLRNLVDYRKDIEAGSNYWTRKLYANDRMAIKGNHRHKALLPCTPLAIVKMLTEMGIYNMAALQPIQGKVVTIFNRSEGIGRPLAVMMSNDGGLVYSFDIHGALCFEHAIASETRVTRAEALAQSDIVITGVPTTAFEKISPAEIRSGTACINFSSLANFEDSINAHTKVYVPRVGPMTVAMCMRNTLRLFQAFHQE